MEFFRSSQEALGREGAQEAHASAPPHPSSLASSSPSFGHATSSQSHGYSGFPSGDLASGSGCRVWAVPNATGFRSAKNPSEDPGLGADLLGTSTHGDHSFKIKLLRQAPDTSSQSRLLTVTGCSA